MIRQPTAGQERTLLRARSADYQRDRDAAEAEERAKQPAPILIGAGVCPSLSIVDFGLSTQHVVYCERHVGPDGKHDDEHPIGPFHTGLAFSDDPRTAHGWQWAE